MVKYAFGLTDNDSTNQEQYWQLSYPIIWVESLADMLLDTLYKIKTLVITQKVYDLYFGEIFCAYRFSSRIKHMNRAYSCKFSDMGYFNFTILVGVANLRFIVLEPDEKCCFPWRQKTISANFFSEGLKKQVQATVNDL